MSWQLSPYLIHFSRHVAFSRYLAKCSFSERVAILIETDLGR